MNKTLKTIGTLAITAIMLASCSSMESDAEKIAYAVCKAKKVSTEIQNGDMSGVQEAAELLQEAEELEKEIKSKYDSDKAEKKAFRKALRKAMKNTECK